MEGRPYSREHQLLGLVGLALLRTGAEASAAERARLVADLVEIASHLDEEPYAEPLRKRRDLWLLGSTRLHLDSVDGLGEFVELETVFGDDTEAAYRAEHERVRRVVGIEERDLVAGSYIDEIAP